MRCPEGGATGSAFLFDRAPVLTILRMMLSDGRKSLYRDRQFVLALLLGPAIWLGLYLFYRPQPGLRWLDDAATFLMVALLWPVVEEVVFRGGLQGWLSEKPWGMSRFAGLSYANMITSVIFSSLHFIEHPPLMAAAVFGPSLIFGHFRDRYSGWLVPSMILHCFYNAGYFMLFPVA